MARTTDVRVRILADMEQFQAQFAKGEISAKRLAREMDRLQGQMMRWNQVEAAAYAEAAARDAKRVQSSAAVGKAIAGVAVAVGLGLGLATKAAMDWESAWADVVKVVGKTDAVTGQANDLAALELQLRSLAKQLPVTAEEIAGVASNAAQLGVSASGLAVFTKAAIDLGQTTSLTAEEASTGLAQLANVMGTTAQDVTRAGSALVYLGNSGASTEQQILDMAQRIAGAGRVIGLSQAQVMGFASAITSTGIEAEAGGTAVSKVFMDMASAVSVGGDSLANFADVAGMSTDQFRELFGRDSAAAVTAFITGLERVRVSGGDVFAVLDQMGMKDARLARTLLSAAGASEMLTRQVEGSTKAWQDNNALLEASSAKYETASAKVAIARNTINDAAITLGGTFLPIVARVAQDVAGMANAFNDLPGPAKTGIAALGGLVAVAATAGGAAMSLVPKVKNLLDALDSMGPKGAKAASGLKGTIGVLGGPWGAALAAGTIALGVWMDKQVQAKATVEEVRQTLDEQTGAVTENTRAWVAKKMSDDGVLDSARKLGLDLATVTDAALGNTAAIAEVTAKVNEYNTALQDAQAATSGVDYVPVDDADVRKVRGAVGDINGALTDAQQKWRDMSDAVGGSTAAQHDAAGAAASTTEKFRLQSEAAKDAEQAVKDFDAALKGLYDRELGVDEAADKAQSRLNALKSTYQDAAGGAKSSPSGQSSSGSKSSSARAKSSTPSRKAAPKSGKSTAQINAEARAAGARAKADALSAGKSTSEAAAAAASATAAVKAREQVTQTAKQKERSRVAADAAAAKKAATEAAYREGKSAAEAKARGAAAAADVKAKGQPAIDAAPGATRKKASTKATASGAKTETPPTSAPKSTSSDTKPSAAKSATPGLDIAKGTTEEAIRVRDALRDVVRADLDLLDAMRKNGATQDEVAAKARALADGLDRQAGQIGITKDVAKKYSDILRQVPNEVATTFTPTGLDAAISKVDALSQRLAIINGKVTTVTIRSDAANVRESRSANVPAPKTTTTRGGTKAMAHGGVLVHAFADGGVVDRPALRFAGGSERHVAQIAHGPRLWAEPETGGEAYIPLASGKRGRSVAILNDVATRFGLNVTQRVAASGGGLGAPRVVTVPVHTTHTERQAINIGQVVARDVHSFVESARPGRRFSPSGVS